MRVAYLYIAYNNIFIITPYVCTTEHDAIAIKKKHLFHSEMIIFSYLNSRDI